ncbi:sec-independent protein translocase protein TatA [Flavobacterium arsenatis]|uniref:Sec-independent protein translocase protein TatA n=1 Tax=Flavobacterium arsenatis TaxID=1484332 RepID=A0ABU1TKE5_9FLAO|nr:twin-arginine translocase TatA/TatE family subunit [Flavobacterium arsenatis]MDR6966451.1 sec-independent protein translocase protein TatA [Flavobacterium arsenatis]
MFGIGGSEIIFIILIVVMLFGADKVPDIARTLGKGMAQLKNATNDIKSEIQRSAEDNGFDKKSLTGGFTEEIDNVKQGFNKMIGENTAENPLNISSVTGDIESEINKAKENIEDMTGPIKRQR